MSPPPPPHEWTPGPFVRAYGDRRADGVVQLSFVLPVPRGERAREAAAQLARNLELGYDAGFGPGTKPSDVASFIVGAVLRRLGKEVTP